MQLAVRTGRHAVSIGEWERTTTTPNPESLAALAAALGVEVADLFDGPPPSPTPTVRPQAAERLRELRLQQGLTQQQLGDKIGVSSQRIGQLERGYAHSSGRITFTRIADALGVDPSEFLTDGQP
jgi:transcriptional regulator with XRE-family HTH domain